MSPEERLDRLERVAKLLATSGRRSRNEFNVKINALIDAQIKSEDQFREQFAKLTAAQDRTDEQIKELAQSHRELATVQTQLAVSQQQTDERLSALIDIVRRDRNGDSS
jgi:hypothetical protein